MIHEALRPHGQIHVGVRAREGLGLLLVDVGNQLPILFELLKAAFGVFVHI